ncbi:hypothetical protein E4U41_000317 [Claviceps citrina]|nr:hypothetical protein E4U41_000317 [Claviceps citrina]
MSQTPMLPSPIKLGGRKRSRDEASTNLEPDLNSTLAVDSPQDWVNGDGIGLIQAVNDHVADCSNQYGAMTHRNSKEDRIFEHDDQTHQLKLRSHKSQRLDLTADTAPLCSTLHQPTSEPSSGDIPSAMGHGALIIDDFTVHLGIGWRSISGDEHIQAAARGWARFIENNFGLTGVRICLESKGLQSYLIEASNGYYLFAENLRQGRLVSSTAEGALANLQFSPLQFEGPELDLMAKSNEVVDAIAESAMVVDS